MKIMPLFEVKNRLSACVDEARRGPVVITRNGKPCAALVAVGEQDLEALLLGHDPRFRALMDGAVARARTEGVPLSRLLPARRKDRRRRPAA